MNERLGRWILGLALVAGTAAASQPPALSQGIFNLSQEEELEIGKQASQEIEKQEPILDDPTVTSYVGRLGQQLVRSSGRSDIPYYFKVVDAAEVNAFALPGGYIYINRGLIQNADNESELAGVLAHEIGHVVARHSAEQIRKVQVTGLGLGILGAILGDKGTGGQLANVASQLVATGIFLKFSREAEREADRLGAQNLYDANYDPRGMITLFEKLSQLRQGQSSSVDKFFSSHPGPEERAENVGELIRSFPYRANLRTNTPEFEQIKRRLEALPPPVKGTDTPAPGTAPATPDAPRTDYPPRTYRGQQEDRELAARYAPDFWVGLSDNPRSDLPTRIDFDGDWDVGNNPRNADTRSYQAPAYLYYGLSETETHFLITYSLYFPFNNEQATRTSRRDTRNNDVESCLVVVEKRNRNDTQGRVALVETFGEAGPNRYVPGASLLGGFQSIQLAEDRVQLYVDPVGHSLSPYTGDRAQLSNATRGILRYFYAGRAEEPGSVRGDRIGFDLLPLYDLWALARNNPEASFGEVADFGTVQIPAADFRGRSERRTIRLGRIGTALAGEQRFSSAGVLPWGYRSGQSQIGAWFLDPAGAVKAQFNLGDEFSSVYLHHPFLEVTR